MKFKWQLAVIFMAKTMTDGADECYCGVMERVAALDDDNGRPGRMVQT